MPITLASYNIHRCIGRDRRSDPQRIVDVINELDADVIALQEVETAREGMRLLDYFAEKTGLPAISEPTLLNEDSEYGNALLTRCDVAAIRRVDLSLPGREPRGAIDVDLACRGSSMRVVATHLGLKPAERRLQVRRLLELLTDGSHSFSALLGDINEWFLWGRPLRWLQGYFEATPAPNTFPTRFPLFALDRIWVHPRTRLRTVYAHDSPLARRASDHLPVRAVVDY